jgi:hypothetical protein
MAKLVPNAEPMGTHEDLLVLARRMAAAKEIHTWFCGLAVLCYFAGIPVFVHRVPGHASIPLYYEGDYSHVTFVDHAAQIADYRKTHLSKYPKEFANQRWAMFKRIGHGEIYLYDMPANVLRHIENDISYELLGLREFKVREISDAAFNAIPIGPPINIWS